MSTVYNEIGIGYNNTRKADPYLVSIMMDLLQPKVDKTYLDIGCGSGNYTKAIAEKGFKFIGIDPSDQMLDYATSKESTIDWRIGSAEKIPLEDASVYGALAILTIHHWTSLQQGFKEVRRVLKSGSSFVVLTTTALQMEGYWLNHYFPKTLKNSMIKMPDREIIEECAKSVGMKIEQAVNYNVKDDLQDQFLYIGKNKPEVYLDPQVRSGISSFSSFANAEEVEIGLAQLQEDIKSGKVKSVMESYKSLNGDYLFLQFKC